ncbi:MAG TPA: polyphenol oxidase family protein [Nocardioidaceae bacterium]|nr:polyphenol oxidase family protein [Nocardioidaceae bacterium]
MFFDRRRCGRVEVAFTDRHDGTSTGPWTSLDLGAGGGDDPAAVERNLALLAGELGLAASDLVLTRQVHGNAVTVIDGTWRAGHLPSGDALVTGRTDVALCVRVADCTPVALADPVRGLAGVVHAGREGLRVGVVAAAVSRLRAMGADALQAWVGPRACGACYEVPDQMRAQVAAVAPASWSTTRQGTPALDVGAGVVEQLRALDVDVQDLATPGYGCTLENPDLYSYRRQGATSGRSAVVVRVHAGRAA